MRYTLLHGTHDLLTSLAIQLALLAAVAGALALLLRRAGFVGGDWSAAVAAGVITGVLLGPGVFGAAAPALRDRIFLTAADQRLALETLDHEQLLEIAALSATGVSAAAEDELRVQHEQDRKPMIDALRKTQSQRRTSLLKAAYALFLLLLLGGGHRQPRRDQRRHAPVARPFVAGAMSALIAGAPAAMLAVWLLHSSNAEAIAFAATLCAGGVAARSTWPRSRDAWRQIEIQRASQVATLIALAASMFAHVGLLPVAAAAALLMGHRMTTIMARWRRARRLVHRLLIGAAAPTMIAAVVVTLDPGALATSRQFWFAALVAAVFSTDGRWLGGWAGWWITGDNAIRNQAWRRSASMLTGGVGALQIGIAAMLAATGDLNDPLLAGAVVGAVAVEVSGPLRSYFARRLDAGEPFSASPNTL